MKKIFLYFAVVISSLVFGVSLAKAKKIASDCTCNGIKLYGRVKIVDHFPDIKVQKVNTFQDLSVQYVKNFPNACGKWQLVDDFPDFTVQFVNHFPDITIKEAAAFPGIK